MTDSTPAPAEDSAPAPPPRVFVSGASGFIGSAVVKALLKRGYAVNALVHRVDLDTPPGADVKTVRGGVSDADALDLAIRGTVAAIHLVGIIRENPRRHVTFERTHVGGTRAVVEAAGRLGVPRLVHMSALGTRPHAASRYHQTKWAAEQAVRDGVPAWTIFRPSMVHGPRGEFMRQVAAWSRGKAAPFLFMPYFGAGVLGLGGSGKLAPVYVDDVARAFVDAIERPHSVGRVYNLAGPEALTWPAFHRLASRLITGRERRPLALPAWWAKGLASLLPPTILPFNRDQVVMSQEDNVGDTTEFRQDFGFSPAPFGEALSLYAKEL